MEDEIIQFVLRLSKIYEKAVEAGKEAWLSDQMSAEVFVRHAYSCYGMDFGIEKTKEIIKKMVTASKTAQDEIARVYLYNDKCVAGVKVWENGDLKFEDLQWLNEIQPYGKESSDVTRIILLYLYHLKAGTEELAHKHYSKWYAEYVFERKFCNKESINKYFKGTNYRGCAEKDSFGGIERKYVVDLGKICYRIHLSDRAEDEDFYSEADDTCLPPETSSIAANKLCETYEDWER